MKTYIGFMCLVIHLFTGCSGEDSVSTPTQDSNSIDSSSIYDSDTSVVFGTEVVSQTGDADASSGADAFELPSVVGSFGSLCFTNSDCASNYCIETQNGKRCTSTCVSDCPNGFICEAISNTGTDTSFICLSKLTRLCDPCKTNNDCNGSGTTVNVCVGYGPQGSFCGVACNDNNPDCPLGFVCKYINDSKTGIYSNQCVPVAGLECSCSQRASFLGLSTPCANQNFYGSCVGERSCKTSGLTKCVGKIPEAESCNKIDDNCDGQLDNIDLKDIGGTCKRTNEFGVCPGVFTGCVNGEPVCNAIEPAPEACNGKDDNCNGLTDESLCDDGNECTTDACNTDGSCKHAKLSGTTCNDGDVCTTLEQCQSGVCIGGNILNCDDNDSCSTDWCDPFTGCAHKPLSNATCLDDGNACTQDVCLDGKCAHPNVKDGVLCLDEGNVCTTDVCALGVCDHIANSLLCDDGNPCTLKDTCKDKTCSVSVLKFCNDGNVCTIDSCDPKIGCVFKPNPSWQDGIPCPDDGNYCTEDICKGSNCAHVPIPGCS